MKVPVQRSWLLVSIALLAACANSPIKIAQTTEQRAYAVYGTFVIVEEQAVTLTSPASTLSPDVKRAIIAANQRAAPVVDNMRKALSAAEQARADFEAAKTTQPALQVVVDKLAGWVAQAQDLVTALSNATKGVKP